MKKFRVEIKEIYRCYIDVDAEDKDSAKAAAEEQVESCDIIAPSDFDIFDRYINVTKQIVC